MTLPTERRRTINDRAAQFADILRGIRNFASEIVDRIDGVNGKVLGARRLLDIQQGLTENRANIASWPYGSLTSNVIRQRLVDEHETYSSVSEVTADIIAANAAFDDLTQDIEALLAVGRAAGQLVDNDPLTNTETEYVFGPSTERDALRLTAVAVRDSMAQ